MKLVRSALGLLISALAFAQLFSLYDKITSQQYIILGLMFAISIVQLSLKSELQGLLALIINSSAVYLTGTSQSFFVAMYLPLMMLYSMEVVQKKAIAVSLILAATYLFLILVNTSNLTSELILHFVGFSSGLILITFCTGYLVNQSKKQSEIVADHKAELFKLETERNDLRVRLREVENILNTQDKFSKAQQIEIPAHEQLIGLTGQSIIMKKVHSLIHRVAPTDATVLIGGPSGTGKEVAARAIHKLSLRSTQKLVVVNCGAIPENLIESELFGHKKGSFTGAVNDHNGLFLEANHGTLFLDEIGELPVHLQAKLLRTLQEKTVKPVGSVKDISIDVRIIAATNRNLKNEVIAGKFREDLFYRLNVVSVQLPSLKERKEDIPLLVHSLIQKIFSEQNLVNKELPVLTPTVMQRFMEYDYPGNVRELENIIERALVLGDGNIYPEHIPKKTISYIPAHSDKKSETNIIELSDIEFPVSLDELLATIEKSYIEKALLQSNGIKKKAAELLGINFRSFRYRFEKIVLESDKSLK